MAEYVHLVRRAVGQLTGHGGIKGLFLQFFSSSERHYAPNFVVQFGDGPFLFPHDCAPWTGRAGLVWKNLTALHRVLTSDIHIRANDVKTGALVGIDKYGNRYYEDKLYFFGRHRWVIYTTEMNGKRTLWDVDGSMVPAEWHRWLHCMTEDPPTTHPPEPKKFLAEIHQINISGTPASYVPYSTTPKKIHEWVPPEAGHQ